MERVSDEDMDFITLIPEGVSDEDMDAIARALWLPPSADRDTSLDFLTCSSCGKISTTKLKGCGRCKKQAYCNKTCQRNHWKHGGHRESCVAVEDLTKEEKKQLPLTWKQVEFFNGRAGERKKLEVRVACISSPSTHDPMLCSSVCYDRVKEAMEVLFPIDFYQELSNMFDHSISVSLHWKDPKFRIYTKHDRLRAVIVRREDLENISFKCEHPRPDYNSGPQQGETSRPIASATRRPRKKQ